jgi:hypothetical protein
VFSVQICLTRVGLGETLEQFPAIACTNSLPFLLDLIYCWHFTSFSVANILLDKSKYQILIFDFYVTKFLCKKQNFFLTFWVCFAAFPASFCLLFFAGSYQEEGETLPKTFKRTSPRTPLGWVTISQLFSL